MPDISDLPKSVQNQLRKNKTKEDKKAIKQGQSWVNTIEDAQALLDAMESNSKFVVISGRKYNVRLSTHGKYDTWFVWPTNDSYVPCGHFTKHEMKSLIAIKGLEDE